VPSGTTVAPPGCRSGRRALISNEISSPKEEAGDVSRRTATRRTLALASVLLGAVLPLPAQQVTLPLARYEELRARANPEATPAPAPPAPFALESADLAITAGPISARIVTRLTLTLDA